MPVTLNAGFRMPSWFDLKTLDATGAEDDEGILKATDLVHGLIGDEVRVSSYMLIYGQIKIRIFECFIC